MASTSSSRSSLTKYRVTPASFPWATFSSPASDERVLTGSFMGTTQLHTDIPKLVTLYKAGMLKLDELITARYPLEKINEAIEAVERGEALRNVIMFK